MQDNRMTGQWLVVAGLALLGSLWAVLYSNWDAGLVIAIWLGIPGILVVTLLGGWCLVFGLVFCIAPETPRRVRRLARTLGSRPSTRPTQPHD
jgi:hypothetical protein